MPLVPIPVPPGVIKPATPLQAKGRYWDSNLVRWQSNKLLPVGGWQRINSTPLDSQIRTIFSWATNDGLKLSLVGCNDDLYTLESSTYVNITPASYIGPENSLYGGYGASDYGELLYGLDYASHVITVAVRTSNVATITTAEAHSYPVGMSVLIAGVSAASFDGTFTITSVPTTTTFTYANTGGDTSSSGGTASLPVADRRPVDPFFIPSFSWTIDNWGEEALAVASSDGRLLHWEYGDALAKQVGVATISTAVSATNVTTITTTQDHDLHVGDSVIIAGVTNAAFDGTYVVTTTATAKIFTYAHVTADATSSGGTSTNPAVPTNNRGVIVTPERHVVCFGCDGESRRVGWSGQEDYTEWNFSSATTTAGFIDLDTQSKIVMAAKVREGTLIFTEEEVWLMKYIGLPYIYGFERIGFGCGLIAPKAFATFSGRCIWMSTNGFWIFDGGYVKPLPSDVSNYVLQDMDPAAGLLYTHGSENGTFNEVWFWYPSTGNSVPDQYVCYNYMEGWWALGAMTRTAASPSGIYPYPIASDGDNYLYYHENGWTAAGASLIGYRYAETGSLNLANGENLMTVKQAITDSGYGYASTELTFYASTTPEAAETTAGPYTPRSSGYTDIRVTGREVRYRVEATEDAPWSVGDIRLDLTPRGKR
jgi:hypothetical protein